MLNFELGVWRKKSLKGLLGRLEGGMEVPADPEHPRWFISFGTASQVIRSAELIPTPGIQLLIFPRMAMSPENFLSLFFSVDAVCAWG